MSAPRTPLKVMRGGKARTATKQPAKAEPQKRSVGQPTKATPTTLQKLVEAIELGATHELACKYAGIGLTSFYKYVAEIPEYAEAIAIADGKGAVENLRIVKTLTTSEDEAVALRAATWILERRYPEQYGRNVVTQQHDGEQVIRVVMDTAWRGEAQVIDSPVVAAIAEASTKDSTDISTEAPRELPDESETISIRREGD